VKARHALFGVGLAAALALPALAADDNEKGKWGTIKGQVVWDGDKLPEREKINVDANPKECLKNGPLLAEKFVVDPKSKGVRWVLVWLVDPADVKKALPVHPDLKEPKDKKVVVDQPCCAFEPHVLGMREGQILVAKNSADITHNIFILGGLNNPQLNKSIPARSELEVPNWFAASVPVTFQCTTHKWMQGYVGVFKHPYFAVTDANGNFEIKNAPAGDYNIVAWHEGPGFLLGEKTNKGMKITIKGDDTTDLGKIKMTPPKE
jgi:hypothetical protein